MQSSSAQIRMSFVVLKALVALLIINFTYPVVQPYLGRLSLYGILFERRPRFPFGQTPAAYNLTVNDLDAMFASHLISAGPKTINEFRVILIGDSSVWGSLLTPQQTLASLWTSRKMDCLGKQMTFYNLGYPTQAVGQDLLIMDYASRFQPDLILWFVTLEGFIPDHQTQGIVSANINTAKNSSVLSELPALKIAVAPFESYWHKTLIGDRRHLADLIRNQLLGILWTATGIDQDYNAENLDPHNSGTDLAYAGQKPPILSENFLSFDVFDAGLRIAGRIPLLLINYPIKISNDLPDFYNPHYPRWAYDNYRSLLGEHVAGGSMPFVDLWDLLPAEMFTNTSFHRSPSGEQILADTLSPLIQQSFCKQAK